MGDDKRARFWKDRRCKEEPLVVSFLELFSIVIEKEALVKWTEQ